MSTFAASIAKLKDVVNEFGSSARADDSLVNKSLFTTLTSIENSIEATSEKSFTNDIMAVLDDVCNGKLFTLTKSFQVLLISIYSKIIAKSPGYINRNILNSMLTICNNKATTAASRDCATTVIGLLMELKANDCGSQINEAVQCLGKWIKSTDVAVRISTIKVLTSMVNGSGSKIGDLHLEIIKLACKLSTDKIPDVRLQLALLIKAVARSSLGCTTLPAEALLTPAIKGIEDDIALVQDAFADGLAAIYTEQIVVYIRNQEQAKFGMARGGGSEKKKAPAQSRMSIARALSTTKKIEVEMDFKTVIGNLFKQVVKCLGALRAGYIATLGYLVRNCLNLLSQDDFEWLVVSLLGVLHDPQLNALPFEEAAFLRTRFSHLIRSSLTSNLTESMLLSFGSQLSKFVASMDSNARTDLEMQLAFSELSHVVTVLGSAAIAILDEVNSAATVHLRHSSFGVRSAAAHVLASLAVVAPVVAVDVLRAALLNTRTQAKQLVMYDGTEVVDVGLDESLHASAVGDAAAAAAAAGAGANAPARKKTAKEAERLQRMYFFHGHTLVISILLKNAKQLPTGLPTPLVHDIYALGIELLQQDVFSAPLSVRHISCSIVRAGSLIVSSCLSLGYDIAEVHLRHLLNCCSMIFKMASATPPSSPSPNQQGKADELIYEIMCVEAALVCISTLLLFCPEALTLEDDCRQVVVEGLETAFRALKNKYQPKYRTHFRFCTLHVILMECFSWLPAGSYPNSCQQVFVESLRVFRDGIQAGFDCTGLCDLVEEDHYILSVGGVSSYRSPIYNNTGSSSTVPGIPIEVSMSESTLMLKLENYATALEKKESEAFLSSFGKDNYPSFNITQASSSSSSDQQQHFTLPCAHIDSRTIDSSILLLSLTFVYQTNEYQDKAIQLCLQAMQQFSKPVKSSMGMFSSEDEKRRKDRKNYSTLRNVVTAIGAIVRAFPDDQSSEACNECTWLQPVSDLLLELLSQPYHSIRSAAASVLAQFAYKFRAASSNILSIVGHKIRTSVMSSLVKKGETMESFSGHLLALSSLWIIAKDEPDVQSLLITTVFDSLRKVDSVIPFKAHGLLALSVVVKGLLQYPQEQQQGGSSADTAMDMVEKVVNLVEVAVANLVYSDELDLFYVTLLRLINNTVALALKSGMNISYLQKLLLVWKQVPSFTSNHFVLNEQMNLFSVAVPFLKNEMLNDFLFLQFSSAVGRCSEYSADALAASVEGIQLLAAKYPEQSCKAGLHGALFKLLDHCLSITTVATLTPYSGVEIRRGIMLEEFQSDHIRRLMDKIVQTIFVLVEADVRVNPDARLSYWILFCRAIALNLKSIGQPSGGGGSGGGAGNAGDGGGDDGFREEGEDDFDSSPAEPQPTGKAGGGVGTTASSSSSSAEGGESVLTYTALAARCREIVLEQVPELKHCRVQIKCVAVRCILIALRGRSTDPQHTDLGLARKRTNDLLSQLSNPSDEVILGLPKPLSLFLNDLINLGCACATFTIDDKPILLLQKESMELIRIIVGLYLNSPDPDIVSQGQEAPPESENKILLQFISQILSAIRLCLAVPYSPELNINAGGALCDLMQGGFITDKVIARRLVKSLFNICETQPDKDDGAGKLQVRFRQSANVSDDIAAAEHVVGVTLLAQLFLLTVQSVSNVHVNETVRVTLASMINEHAAVLAPIWRAVALDAVRVIADSETVWDDENQVQSEQSRLVNPLRGGLTYGSVAVKLHHLVPCFRFAVPIATNAFVLSKSFQAEQHTQALFSVCALALKSESLSGQDAARLISALIQLLAKDPTNAVPNSEWLKVLRSLQSLLQRGQQSESTICVLTHLVASLLKRLEGASTWGELWTGLLQVSLSLLQTLLPGLFQSRSTAEIETALPSVLSVEDLAAHTPQELHSVFTQAVGNQPSTPVLLFDTLRQLCQKKPSEQVVSYSVRIHINALLYCASLAPMVKPTSREGCGQIVSRLVESLKVVACSHPTPAACLTATCSQVLDSWSVWCDRVTTSPSAEVVNSVAESVLLAWRAAATALIYLKDVVPVPHRLSALILREGEASTAISKAAIQASFKCIQSFYADVGSLIAESTFPALVCKLSAGDIDGETRALLAKSLLSLVSLAAEENKGAVVELIVTPLCDAMTRNPADQLYLTLCGRGFTHLARMCPDAFKAQVAQLSEGHRAVLQQVMMQALQSQQAVESSQQASHSSGGAPALKINMAKFKTAS